jgi:hypothetical protein
LKPQDSRRTDQAGNCSASAKKCQHSASAKKCQAGNTDICPTSPVEPTEDMTFTTWGIVDFQAQYWNGLGWATVSGGSVTSNNKVWKKINFSQDHDQQDPCERNERAECL